jgi:predicted nucleic acid-binding protein
MLSLVLQEPSHWQVIDRLISNPAITLVLPGPVLAEVIYTARRKGKRTAANLLAQTLFANGIRVVHPIDEYLIRAAELHEIASAPGGTASGQRTPSLPLAGRRTDPRNRGAAGHSDRDPGQLLVRIRGRRSHLGPRCGAVITPDLYLRAYSV